MILSQSGPAPFGPTDLEFTHPEAMANFMPHGIGDQLFQFRGTLRQTFVRSLIDGDLVREGKALAYAANSPWASLIKPKKVLPRRLSLHYEDDIFK